MAKLAQGTNLYFIDALGAIHSVAAVGVTGLSAQRDSLESTNLTDQAKTFLPGLMSPGSASFSIQFDPSNAVHIALHDAYRAGDTMKWALGWSDATVAPTVTAGDFVLPTTRSFLTFSGFVQDVTFDFSLNSIVTSQVSVQVSGMPVLSAKA